MDAVYPLKHPRFPEFSHVNSYWDPIQNVEVVRILAGEFYVTRSDQMISTVLGSCVSACIRDTVLGIGGMNHFMLPGETIDRSVQHRSGGFSSDAAYGTYAMEQLINCIFKYGGRHENLEVKIFGGGRIIGHMSDIGAQNIEFARNYLHIEGLTMAAEDVGEDVPRRVAYFPVTGKAWIKKLRHIRNETIIQQETAYLGALRHRTAKAGDVELFGNVRYGQ